MWRFTPEAVQEKYGLSPAQYPDFAALRGDPSDNLPNIPSVGEKTATKWVAEFGDLDALVARVDEVKGKAGDALRAHLAQVVQNRQLDRAGPRRPDRGDAGRPGARQLGARRGAPRSSTPWSSGCCGTGSTPPSRRPTPEADEGFEVTFTLLGPGEVARVAGWRTRRSGAPDRRAHLGLLGRRRAATSPASRWRRPTARAAGSTRGPRPGRRAGVRRPGSPTPTAPKALHDAKGPSLAFAARGWDLRGVTSDTALSAYLAMPDQRSYDLADLALRYLRRELRAEEGDGGGQLSFGLDGGDDTAAAESDVLRARAVLELADALDTELANKEATELLRDVELPLVRGAGRDGAHRHRGGHRPPGRPRGAVRRRGQGRRRRGVRGDRQARSTSARPSSCRCCSSTSSACPRPSAPRPATRPTPTRCRRCSPRPGTRSSRPCCGTATPPGSRSPSTGCSRRSPTTAASTRRSTR